MKKNIYNIAAVILASFILSACGKQNPSDVQFSEDNAAEDITPYSDIYAGEKINITKSSGFNQTLAVSYKSFNPDGVGKAEFKARSMKEINAAALATPAEGKKLILVEISVRGNAGNKGYPSTFNQIGQAASPQFVLIDPKTNKSEVETTYFSDAYTVEKKLFELSKITMDHETWVDTAIVFEIDAKTDPNLALRFTNPEGNLEFYDINE